MPNNDTPDKAMVEALTRWRDNLKITQASPVVGDPLSGVGLDFVIEQLDSLLASNSPVVGEDAGRCPKCGAEWCDQRPWTIPTDTADRREAIANAAVEQNLNPDGSPKFGSAQGYACALAAVKMTPESLIAGSPEGFVVVPVEPTEAMIEAGRVDIQCRRDCRVSKVTGKQVWSAMITARPGADA